MHWFTNKFSYETHSNSLIDWKLSIGHRKSSECALAFAACVAIDVSSLMRCSGGGHTLPNGISSTIGDDTLQREKSTWHRRIVVPRVNAGPSKRTCFTSNILVADPAAAAATAEATALKVVNESTKIETITWRSSFAMWLLHACIRCCALNSGCARPPLKHSTVFTYFFFCLFVGSFHSSIFSYFRNMKFQCNCERAARGDGYI